MKKRVLNISLILLMASTGSVFAQQGFGTNTPDKSAAVDISSTNKGLLIPRMDLTWNATDDKIVAPVTTPAKGLLVYNQTGITEVPEGFYYFSDGKWHPIRASVLSDGTNTTVTGTGTASDPYVVNVKSLTGDVTGDVLTNKVVKIQNVPVSATGPTIGQVLKEVSGTWTPSTLTGSDISDAKTISATSPVKVNNAASVAGATLKDVSITVDKASNTQLGVVQIGSNINVDTDGVISVDFPDGTVDTNTTTTVSSKTDQTYVTVDQSQTTGLPGDVINTRDYKIGVNKATSTTLGVVMPGTGMSIDTDGKLNVTPVADVLTSLTQDASGIHYKPETGAVQDAKVVSANTANIISVDATDFGAFLKAEDIRANQTTTTVKGTAPISVTPAAANVTGNTEYTVSANVATAATVGVVMPGTGMSIDTDGKLNVTVVDTNTDAQQLSLDGNMLKLDRSTPDVDLSKYLDNTDNQTITDLSFTANVLSVSLERGNTKTVDLSALAVDTNTDEQQLSLTGNTLSISNGNDVDLAKYLDNKDEQKLTYNETTKTLTLERGGDPIILNGIDTNSKAVVTAAASNVVVTPTTNTTTDTITYEVAVKNAMPKFFYMPSVLIDTSAATGSVNLYATYTSQFTSPLVSSSSAEAGGIPTLTAKELDFYVTYYDNTVINNIVIDVNGNMTYNVIGAPTNLSFVNVVFKVRTTPKP